MSIADLERSVRPGERLLIDTASFIAYLNGGEPTTPLAVHVIDEMVLPGRNPAIVSMVSIMEVLIRPLRTGAPEAYQHVMDFMVNFPNLTALPVDLVVAQEAASVRAMFRLSAPDALIVATGLVTQVHHLVTNDGEWSRKLQPIASRIRVCQLDRFV